MRVYSFFILFFLTISFYNYSKAEVPSYLDFKYILNSSDAGKKAQDFLKNKLEKGLTDITKKEKNILEEEKQIISQKKIISQEEYKKKVSNLRNKVSSLQKERNELLETIAKKRSKAKETLLKNLNPIVKEYMIKNNIRMVIDKKNILLADDKLDITKEVIALLNKKLNSINLK
tara:strand:+ start:2559 stop:3080 length:522 start_codon:yes stop_codon:yes gene_type:complete